MVFVHDIDLLALLTLAFSLDFHFLSGFVPFEQQSTHLLTLLTLDFCHDMGLCALLTPDFSMTLISQPY